MFRLLTFNIDAARREEQHADTRMDQRFAKIMEVIRSADADIVCLQELRNLDTSKYQVCHFVTALMEQGYDVELVYYTPYVHSFAMAICYRRSKFFAVDVQRFFYHPQSNDNPAAENNHLCAGVCFRDLRAPNAKRFWVFNTHLSMEEERKWQSVAAIKQHFCAAQFSDPFVLAGDFNFFDDRDGCAQRTQLIDSGLLDLAHPLELSDGSALSGTFIGFEHDAFKRDVDSMSRLDHIFSRGIAKFEHKNALACVDSRSTLERRTYASDHVAILVQCCVE